MIQYVEGDILMTKADALAHGVAPNDNFGQGLALSLKENWPSLYKDFKHYSHSKHPKEGTLWSWKGVNAPVIINLLTQEHPKSHNSHPGPAKLKYVRNSLKELAKEAKDNNLKSLAITKVATGVGGLDWAEVKPLIDEYLAPLDCKVFVYETYKKDTEALEN